MASNCHVLSVLGGLGYGGDENRLLSMINAMDRGKFRFSIVVLNVASELPHDYDNSHGSLEREFRLAGVPIYLVHKPKAARWLPRRLQTVQRIFKTILAVRRIALRLQVDVVDARTDPGIMVGVPAAVLTGRPSVSTLYFSEPRPHFLFWRLVRFITLNLTQAVITDSRVRQVELARWRWGRPGSTWNIPNGIDPPLAVSAAEIVRATLQIPSEPGIRIIGQIAGLVAYKGQAVLLEAACKVLAKDSRALFLLIGYSRGNNSYVDELHRAARRLGIEGRVRIASYPHAIGDVWQIVDIHVHATLFDSLPNAIIEGMSLGKPLVATTVGGIPSAVEHEVSGLLVRPSDPTALSQALLRLLANPAEAQAFGREAYRRYLTSYQATYMARSLESCLESVITRDHQRVRRAV